jgi:NAD-dependent dihydropyrimidine dehydrogenase PreA subunit
VAYKISEECIVCGICMDECAVGAIKEGADMFTIDSDLCTDCGNCVDSCPNSAIVED